jgi:phenylpropionate dioxygenase-like ring-hydroxylating dioxygenase large terminal subunit
MAFIKNLWYVAAWATEMKQNEPLARVIIGEPIVIWRDSQGSLVGMDNRCPHRLAPLSKGRFDGDTVQCMYHGMRFSKTGECLSVQGSDQPPASCAVKTYPVVEKDDWIWIWMGDSNLADESQIPDAWGLNNDKYVMIEDAIDYEAHYELINDNLCDLSHLDFVHETTLGAATGQIWSEDSYDISLIDNGLYLQRWLTRPLDPNQENQADTWNTYRYLLPGLFLMTVYIYPRGTAEKLNYAPPPEDFDVKPLMIRVEQQAVTPISETETRYLFATGTTPEFCGGIEDLRERMDVVIAAFTEDREMIEAQQKMWNLTDENHKKVFIPYDKAPNMMRRLISRRLKEEAAEVS